LAFGIIATVRRLAGADDAATAPLFDPSLSERTSSQLLPATIKAAARMTALRIAT
jgi:hypothetical protein